MHENGIVAEVSERLQQAGLIPPVQGLIWQGSYDDDEKVDAESESVLIDVAGPVSAQLELRLSEVLHGLAYELQSVHPGHGITYGGGPDRRPTR